MQGIGALQVQSNISILALVCEFWQTLTQFLANVVISCIASS